MSTVLYYFSGTGNSLYIAKRLAEQLGGDACVVPVIRYIAGEKISPDADTVGFVFPVYFMTAPEFVQEFITELEFKLNPYIFAVATCNGGPGHTLYTVNRLLKKKGNTLGAGFTVDMPGNSLIIRDFMNPPEVQNERLMRAEERVAEIAAIVKSRKTGVMAGTNGLKGHLQGFLFSTVVTKIYRTPTKFETTGLCTKCNICCTVCVKKNIRMGVDGPEWGGDCVQCLACFHWCPQSAIEIGKNTSGKPRYHHPAIRLQEMTDALR